MRPLKPKEVMSDPNQGLLGGAGIRCYLSSVYRKISLEVFTIQA